MVNAAMFTQIDISLDASLDAATRFRVLNLPKMEIMQLKLSQRRTFDWPDVA